MASEAYTGGPDPAEDPAATSGDPALALWAAISEDQRVGRARAKLLLSLLLCVSASTVSCSNASAIKLTVWHDACVIGWDRIDVEVEVEEGSIVWSSTESPGFLAGGPEDIAIAVDVDVEQVTVHATASAGDRRVGSRSRVISFDGATYLEEEITLEGCRCGSRDTEYCEPFTGGLDFGWNEQCNCSASGNCDNTFVVEDPGMPRVYGEALHMRVGADGPDGEPCVLYRPIDDAAPDRDLYVRAFLRGQRPDGIPAGTRSSLSSGCGPEAQSGGGRPEAWCSRPSRRSPGGKTSA